MPAIDPASVETQTFDWGAIKWLITPDTVPGAALTFGEVVMQPGEGHGRHNHPGSEEILYVLSGEGLQMVNDEEPFAVRASDTIYIGESVYHSTVNTGWEPMRVLAIYNPGGPERLLRDLPDFRAAAPGVNPVWTRG